MAGLYGSLRAACKNGFKSIAPKAASLVAITAGIGLGMIAATALKHHNTRKTKEAVKDRSTRKFSHEERNRKPSCTYSSNTDGMVLGARSHKQERNSSCSASSTFKKEAEPISINEASRKRVLADTPPVDVTPKGFSAAPNAFFIRSSSGVLLLGVGSLAVGGINQPTVPSGSAFIWETSESIFMNCLQAEAFETDSCCFLEQGLSYLSDPPVFVSLAYGDRASAPVPAICKAKWRLGKGGRLTPRMLGPPFFCILTWSEPCEGVHVDTSKTTVALTKSKGKHIMLKESQWQSHEDYIAYVDDCDRDARLLTGQSLFRTPSDIMAAMHMTYFNLDRAKPLIMSFYSEDQGRPTKVQNTIRSLFLYVACLGRTGTAFSLDDWVIEVKCRKELYVLCGCSSPDEVPSVGSHYNLIDRFWAGDKKRYSKDAIYDACSNHSKGKIKLGEDKKVDEPESITEMVSSIYEAGIPLGRNYERYLQQFHAFMGVYPSMKNGCIPKVICAGWDSSALKEHASPFGTCECGRNRLTCKYRSVCGRSARFSAPDISIGYDNGEDKKFAGQHLVILSCSNPVTHTDLPLSFTLVDANRHDSVTVYAAMQEFHRNVSGAHIHYICGDKAYGYRVLACTMLKEGTVPLFDIASNHRNLKSLPKEVVLDGNAVPCCQDGVRMTLLKNDTEKQCWHYGCPLKSGERKQCPNADKCSIKDTTIIIDPKEDPNIFPTIPRDDERYQKIYNLRSGNERVNDRLLNDYFLATIQTRNVNHRSFFIAMGCILVHQDAWYKTNILPDGEKAAAFFTQQDEELKRILANKCPQKLPSPEPGTKVDTDAIMQMLLQRNRKEKMEDYIRNDRLHDFYDAIEAAQETQPAWKCPREQLAQREPGVDPLANPTEPFMFDYQLLIDWNEAYFVKKWERTYIPYIPHTVVLDPDGCVVYTPPSEFMPVAMFNTSIGVLTGFSEYVPEAAKKKVVVNGFELVKKGVWVRPGPEIAIMQQRPPEPELGALEQSGFVEFVFTPENCHSMTYTPPPIAGITWETEPMTVNLPITDQTASIDHDLKGNSFLDDSIPSPNSLGNRTSPKLQRNERFRAQPLPYRFVKENMKRYEESKISL